MMPLPLWTIAMGVMLYALIVYQMRARSIRLRTGAPYDDRLGPVSLFHLALFRLRCIRSFGVFGLD